MEYLGWFEILILTCLDFIGPWYDRNSHIDWVWDDNANLSYSLCQNFYKNEIDRQEMYIRYIYKLRDLHLASNNFTEAGFTLLLHANLLDWRNTPLPADHSFPGQLEWQRKEMLYQTIINYFDTGKVRVCSSFTKCMNY